MAVLEALRTTPALMREQPVLFLPLAIFGLLQLPQLFLGSIDPVLSILVSLLFTAVFVFVTPLFYAGAIGMADDAATGTRTSVGRFWKHARENYVSVLVAYLVITAISFGFSIVLGVAVFVAVFAVGLSTGNLLAIVAAAGVVLLFALAFLVAMFALHFYTHAIVIDGEGAIGGLSRSAHVVSHNVMPVAGYGVLSLVLGGAMGTAYGLATTFGFPVASVPGEPAPTPELVPAILGSVAVVAATTLFATFFAVFSVVFYREITASSDATREDTDGTAAGNGPDGAHVAD